MGSAADDLLREIEQEPTSNVMDVIRQRAERTQRDALLHSRIHGGATMATASLLPAYFGYTSGRHGEEHTTKQKLIDAAAGSVLGGAASNKIFATPSKTKLGLAMLGGGAAFAGVGVLANAIGKMVRSNTPPTPLELAQKMTQLSVVPSAMLGGAVLAKLHTKYQEQNTNTGRSDKPRRIA